MFAAQFFVSLRTIWLTAESATDIEHISTNGDLKAQDDIDVKRTIRGRFRAVFQHVWVDHLIFAIPRIAVGYNAMAYFYMIGSENMPLLLPARSLSTTFYFLRYDYRRCCWYPLDIPAFQQIAIAFVAVMAIALAEAWFLTALGTCISSVFRLPKSLKILTALYMRIALMGLAFIIMGQIAQQKIQFMQEYDFTESSWHRSTIDFNHKARLCRNRNHLPEFSQTGFDKSNLEPDCNEIIAAYNHSLLMESSEIALTGLYDSGAIIASQLMLPVAPYEEESLFLDVYGERKPWYLPIYSRYAYRVLASAGATILLYIALAWGVIRVAQAYTVRRGMFAPS
jgi:hypothetical protein